ncbi:MAG TPA: DUF5818 domain-containing protein [Terriglobales bacterium]|nr:DUF5818 domain-containing protein [Terriglobales bacterium]
MNRTTVLVAALVLAVSLAVFAGDEDTRTFRGEISDSQCALNVHSLTQSHQEMLKSKSGDAGRTPASCSQFCIVHMGGKFVLASKEHVYHLDNQDLPRGFVGEKVKVRGILDPRTDVIHVTDIEPE